MSKVDEFKKWKSERMGHPYPIILAEEATNEQQERIKELEAKLAQHETKINCWSCGKSQSLHQHAENDGFCIRCDAEIELGLG